MTDIEPESSRAGWYADPRVPGQNRWWDGTVWTTATQAAENVTAPAAPAASEIAPSGFAEKYIKVPKFVSSRISKPSPSRQVATVQDPPVETLSPEQSAPASSMPVTKQRVRWEPSTWIVGSILGLILIIALATGGFGPFFIWLGLVVLCSAIWAVVTNRRSWARIRSRGIGVAIIGASLVVLVVGAGINGVSNTALTSDNSADSIAPASKTPSPTPTPKATKAPVDFFSAEEPEDPSFVTAGDGQPSVVVANTTVTDTSAVALLATLAVKGKAPMTGYGRVADFGTAWIDVDHNGCDTRNDVLARDLTGIARSGDCRVVSGTLTSPYTGQQISFVRGNTTSTLVQIDHVVSLGDAWQTGAQQLTGAQRISLANDPLNLLAVDGRSNEQKGDGDTATWLPANKQFRCDYVARQVSVKATYGLWVTVAEHDAMARVLDNCADLKASTSTFTPAPPPPVVVVAPVPAPVAAPHPAAPPAPVRAAPVAPAPAPAPAPAGAVHPGAFCSNAGATGVTVKGTPMVCTTSATDTRLRWRSQ